MNNKDVAEKKKYPVLSNEEIKIFQKKILDFAKTNYRVFPWRNTVDPYEILVSEIMLQQTQTERVVPKYTEWLHSFPTMQSLAKASLPEVLTHWNGLGYNRRARFLQQAAKMILEKYNGIFPQKAELIDELPGVGEYTAKAVACFAFGAQEVFIETNIRTVYLSTFILGHEIENNKNEKSQKSDFQVESDSTKNPIDDTVLLSLIKQTLYKKDVRLWYYALMDYGAKIKKEIGNLNRVSANYVKQSKFKGSLRQARGAIVRQLTRQKRATLAEIAKKEDIEIERIQEAAEKLIAEEIIEQNDGAFIIKK